MAQPEEKHRGHPGKPTTMADTSIEWEAIERSPEFRALVASRRRFVMVWGGGVSAVCAAFVVVAYLAPDVFGEALGWVVGVGLIVATWIVSFAYLRKSDREWSPMEQRIAASRREPSGRFERAEERERVS
jgi:uncharacterized membrane protein (DUF485 family)